MRRKTIKYFIKLSNIFYLPTSWVGYYAGKSIESAFHRLIIYYSPLSVIDHGSLREMLEKENCLHDK